MATDDLEYRIRINAETGELTVVGDKLKDLGKHTQGWGDSFGRVGQIIAGLGLARVLEEALSQALRSSQAFQELRDQLEITADGIVKDFEPAINLISKGLQGLLVYVSGLVTAWKFFFQGEIKKGLDAWLDGISAAGERVQGLTRITLEKQLEILHNHNQIMIADESRSAADRLAVIQRAQDDEITLLRQTARFQASNALDQENQILSIKAEYAQQKRRIALKEQADRETLEKATVAMVLSNLDASEREVAGALQRQVDAVESTNARKRDLIQQEMDIERQAEDIRYAEQRESLERQIRDTPARKAELHKALEALEQAHYWRLQQITTDGTNKIADIDRATALRAIELARQLDQATMEALGRRLAQTHNFHKAMQAAGDAAVIQTGRLISQEIQEYIPLIAIKAYNWGATWGGPVGGAIAAAAAIAGAEAIAAGASVGAQAAVGSGEGGIPRDTGGAPSGGGAGGTATRFGAAERGAAPGSTILAGPSGGNVTIIQVSGGDHYETNRLAIAIAERNQEMAAQTGGPQVTSG